MCVLQQFNLVVLLLQYLRIDIDTFSTKNSLVKNFFEHRRVGESRIAQLQLTKQPI